MITVGLIYNLAFIQFLIIVTVPEIVTEKTVRARIVSAFVVLMLSAALYGPARALGWSTGYWK